MTRHQNIIPATASVDTSRPRHALVVDDSRLQRRILSATLKAMGYDVTEAVSGIHALQACDKECFDLILSDWMMPEMSGPDFCQAFRGQAHDTYSYIILLTSKSEKEDIAFGLESGADDFLTKPVNSGELRARIAAGQRIVEMQSELHVKNQEVNAALAEINRLYDLLDNDLLEAKKLQLSLLPDRKARFGQTEISLILQSSGHVGGDLVGYFPINTNHIGFFSLDVSGHGISSALMTARLAGYLTGSDPLQNVAIIQNPDGSIHPKGPAQVVSRLNNLMFAGAETDHYFTVLYGVCNPVTGRIIFCQAGHPHPVLIGPDGQMKLVGAGGLPVGLIEDATYEQTEVTLAKGDRFITVSDGITEALGADDVMLGEEGLMSLLADHQHKSGVDLLEGLVWSLAQLGTSDDFDDDVSALMVSAT